MNQLNNIIVLLVNIKTINYSFYSVSFFNSNIKGKVQPKCREAPALLPLARAVFDILQHHVFISRKHTE